MRTLLLLLLAAVSVRGDVTLAPLFADHAVLQQGKPTPVWGQADPGERVEVRFGDQRVGATAGADGRWMALLEPLTASTSPADLIVAGKTTVTVSNVLVGEVWLCAGQSNMEWPVSGSADAGPELAAAQQPMIRLFRVPHRLAESPVATTLATWEPCTPQTAGGFSAIAFAFGRDLQQRLGIPVGLIQVTWGGSPIESWLSPAPLVLDPRFSAVHQRWLQALHDFPEAKAAYETNLAAWQADQEAAAKKKAPFTKPRPREPWGPGHVATPSGIFNGMVHPLLPYAARGLLWYQGESNTSRAHEYGPLFQELIASWRRHLAQPDLHVLWVQLPNYRAPEGQDWAALREAQASALALPLTGQAVAIDLGDPNDLHPRNKREVARRLGLLARAWVYGSTVDHSGPLFAGATQEGRTLRVRFDHAGSGLIARNKPVQSLFVAGADRRFFPATARIDRETLVVSAPEVPEPVAVRYAWSNAPEANLYNGAGLPAVPFRSDAW